MQNAHIPPHHHIPGTGIYIYMDMDHGAAAADTPPAGEEIVDAEAARCTALQPWKATAIEAWTLEIVYQ